MHPMESFFKEHTVPFGTFWKKLTRRNDPQTSKEAAKAVDTTKLEKAVLEAIASFPEGCISEDVQDKMCLHPYSSVTARFSALYRKGFIEYTGELRRGRSGRNQRVMKVNEEYRTARQNTPDGRDLQVS